MTVATVTYLSVGIGAILYAIAYFSLTLLAARRREREAKARAFAKQQDWLKNRKHKDGKLYGFRIDGALEPDIPTVLPQAKKLFPDDL
jgi:hypothetical protein